MEKVEDIKRPLVYGEVLMVPCIVDYDDIDDILFINPVINLPHSDKENGQNEDHYHTDFRFVKHKYGRVEMSHSRHKFVSHPMASIEGYNIRPRLGDHGRLEYYPLPVVNTDFFNQTPVGLIKNSKLNRKCIHKGKCPHRGFDLSQVKAKNGKITCPLHGLEFDAASKKLLNHTHNQGELDSLSLIEKSTVE